MPKLVFLIATWLLIFLSSVTEGGCQDLSAEVAGLQQEVQELRQLLSQLLGAEVVGNGKAVCRMHTNTTSSWLSRKRTCHSPKEVCESLSSSNRHDAQFSCLILTLLAADCIAATA